MSNEEERRQDMAGIGERLARIETGQAGIKSELEKVVSLLDRMVRVEERLVRVNDRVTALEGASTEHTRELASWKSVRRVGVWVAGIVGAVVAAVGIKHWG
ncbi:MAG: hypothetical protein GY938_20450 [Ketobacter sp.]|nr:hypothetical protein [Ketobacter sp.]